MKRWQFADLRAVAALQIIQIITGVSPRLRAEATPKGDHKAQGKGWLRCDWLKMFLISCFLLVHRFHFLFGCLVAVGWTAWIGWCGRSSGSVVKMAFVPGISAKDEVSRDIMISRYIQDFNASEGAEAYTRGTAWGWKQGD